MAWIALAIGASGSSDLAIQSVWPPGNIVTATTNSFALNITNAGPDSAGDILVSNALPTTLAFVSAFASQGSCSHSDGSVVCVLGEVPAEEAATITVSFTSITPGTFTNIATLFSSSDTNPSNNVAIRVGQTRLPLLFVATTNVMEGDNGTTNLPFTFWLEAAQAVPASFDYRTSNIEAAAGVDYLGSTGTVIFPPGVITQVVDVTIFGDRLYEGFETQKPDARYERINLSVFNGTNLLLGQVVRPSGRILDDDPMPALSVADTSVMEGDSGTTNAQFMVFLSDPSGVPTSFRWATSNNTAVAGADFTGGTAIVSIPAGQTNLVIPIPVIGDTLFEPDEAFHLFLLNPGSATISRTQAVATIISDELGIVPVTLNENAGIVPGLGEVFVGGPKNTDLVVTLASSLPFELIVPFNVVILQGQTNAHFDVTTSDDMLLNGSRSIVISASASNHAAASATFSLHDDERTTLTLVVPSPIEEGSLAQTGRLELANAPDLSVNVPLFVDDPSSIQVPPFVRLAPGQTVATFPITAPDDSLLDGNKTVTLAAAVQNWSNAVASITVLDRTNLALTIPTDLVEGQWATGIVQITAAVATNLPISIRASNETVIAFPDFVIMPANELTTTFAFQAVENSAYNGTQQVVVTASCPVLWGTTNSIVVYENDPHHFTISRIPVSREAYVLYYDLVLTARDETGQPLIWFTRPASLTAAGALGEVMVYPSTTASFTTGVLTHAYYFRSWDNNVRLTISDGQDHIGQSNPFNIARPFHHELPLAVGDLAWDAARRQICASIRDYYNSVSNCLAFINPDTGKIVETLYVGQSPGDLAITEDSNWLYIGLLGTNVVRRLNLATRTIDLEFSLGVDFIGRQIYAEEIEVQPGTTSVVAISRAIPTSSPRHEGIAVYDNGTLRPVVYDAFFGPNPIEFGGSPTRLYGYDTQSSTFGFHRMNITASGVQPLSSASIFQGYGLNFRYANGRIYVTSGAIYNPETGAFIGSFPNAVEPLPAPDIGRVICLRQNGPYSDLFQVFDESTLAIQHFRYIPGAFHAVNSVRCGESTVAFNTSSSQLYILYSDFLADLDQDGLVDEWERQHFGNSSSTNGPAMDSDNDGLTNLDESVAGTDPNSAASRLAVIEARPSGPDNQITFATAVGRCYRLERTSELSPANWTTVDEVPGTGTTISVRDPGAAGIAKGFYRVAVFR